MIPDKLIHQMTISSTDPPCHLWNGVVSQTMPHLLLQDIIISLGLISYHFDIVYLHVTEDGDVVVNPLFEKLNVYVNITTNKKLTKNKKLLNNNKTNF